MFVNTFIKRILFNFFLIILIFLIHYFLFYNLYISDTIIINFAIHPFNFCEVYPDMWLFLKIAYIPTTFISSLIIINTLYSSIFKNQNTQKNISNSNNSDLYLTIFNETNKNLIIEESGLYQNFLITGTIGSGKTSSVMYPLTKQLIHYNSENPSKKIGMLILDVKGNYYSQVKKYTSFYHRDDDLIVIEIRSEILSIIRLISLI